MSADFEFAILGDSQPEGLLLGSALARKGFSVCVLPSESLGELPTQRTWPIRLPENLGDQRLDEFLFRAGFFRLEDSGLSPAPMRNQFVFPKHRVTFDGSHQTWLKEITREFPALSERVLRIKELIRQAGDKQSTKHLPLVQKLIRADESFEQLAMLECFEGRHINREARPLLKSLTRKWTKRLQAQEAKVFRESSELSQPYHQFLLDHARKWGVQVIEESPQLRIQWGGVEIVEGKKAKYLIPNTLAGAKLVHQLKSNWVPHRISHWLYFDRIDCAYDDIPEPLDEFVYLNSNSTEASANSLSLLYISRDRLRDRAQITLGSWLPFDDSREWEQEIMASRQRLSKLLPFLDISGLREVPSTLELSEMKGECVRRAEIERLLFVPPAVPKGFTERMRSFFGKSRVIDCLPYVGRSSDRRESLQECLRVLNYFEKKRRSPRSAEV